ncbi:MAG: DUF2461 domain-containing protein [Cytophagales bacterium]
MDKILGFLTLLKDNNNKVWFDANKREYSLARKDFEIIVTGLLEKLSIIDEGFKSVETKNCIFRINRDVRFSNDKSPYKSNFAAWFTKHGKKAIAPGYYLHLQPGASFLAAGIYMPMPEELKKIRQEIDYNSTEWLSILNDESFKSNFDGIDQEHKLKTKPTGYDLDNPMIEYLKLKSFTISKLLKDEELYDSKLISKISDLFTLLKPFNTFLENAIHEE